MIHSRDRDVLITMQQYRRDAKDAQEWYQSATDSLSWKTTGTELVASSQETADSLGNTSTNNIRQPLFYTQASPNYDHNTLRFSKVKNDESTAIFNTESRENSSSSPIFDDKLDDRLKNSKQCTSNYKTMPSSSEKTTRKSKSPCMVILDDTTDDDDDNGGGAQSIERKAPKVLKRDTKNEGSKVAATNRLKPLPLQNSMKVNLDGARKEAPMVHEKDQNIVTSSEARVASEVLQTGQKPKKKRKVDTDLDDNMPSIKMADPSIVDHVHGNNQSPISKNRKVKTELYDNALSIKTTDPPMVDRIHGNKQSPIGKKRKGKADLNDNRPSIQTADPAIADHVHDNNQSPFGEKGKVKTDLHDNLLSIKTADPPNVDHVHGTTQTPIGGMNAKTVVPAGPVTVQVTQQKKKMTFQDQVLQHLLNSLKPFTLKILATELKTTDAALHNLMLSLIDKKIVLKKEFKSGGEQQKKSKELYWVDYDRAMAHLSGSFGSKNTEKDRKLAKEERDRLLKEETFLMKEIKELSGSMPLNIIRERLIEEDQNVCKLKVRLNEAKARNIKSTVASPKHFEKRVEAMRREMKMRKCKVIDFVETMADAMEERPKDVMKRLELQMD